MERMDRPEDFKMDARKKRVLEQSTRKNLLFLMVFASILFLGAYFTIPVKGSPPQAPSVTPGVFATLLIAITVGVLQLAGLMRRAVDPNDFDAALKHFDWFLRLLVVSVTSGLAGLIISVFVSTTWFGVADLIISAISLFFILFRSLDYIFV